MIDFVLHAGCSLILFIFFARLFKSYKVAFLFTLMIGIGKECVDWLDYGLFSLSDLEHDFVGISIGGMICLQLKEHWMK